MANGYFERGEVYAIRMDSGMGSEQGYFRPGVIISNNKGNATSSTVNVAFTTTKLKPIGVNVEIMATSRPSWVLCNQVATVDKIRIGNMMGVLNSQEMKEVDAALEEVFDLGYVDEAALKEKDSEIANRDVLIGDLKTEMAGAAAEIAKRNEEIASLKMEIEMWQKCYGRCMDMLVDTKVNSDLSRRAMIEPKVGTAASLFPDLRPEPPKQPEPPVEEPVEEYRLDINNCTATALKKVGFSLAVARKIVVGRPFTSVEDLKRVNGVKASLYRILEPKLCCNAMKKPVVNGGVPDPGYEEDGIVPEAPVKPEVQKVNVNLVKTASELTKLTGMCSRTTNGIINYRKAHGKFTCLEDLLKTPAFGTIALKRYGHLLEV